MGLEKYFPDLTGEEVETQIENLSPFQKDKFLRYLGEYADRRHCLFLAKSFPEEEERGSSLMFVLNFLSKFLILVVWLLVAVVWLLGSFVYLVVSFFRWDPWEDETLKERRFM